MSKNKGKKVIPALDNSGVQQDSNIVVDEIQKEKSAESSKSTIIAKESKKNSKETVNKPAKKKKEKKESKIARRLKETGSELKKVTWPTFPKLVKQTGVVLAVVIFFGLILFGFDYLLKFLFELLV